MKKLGFTLSEVLITLSIIGVIAALTIPTLVQNGRDEANAAKLSVIVNALENAFTTALTKEGKDSLFDTAMWGNVADGTYENDENGVAKKISIAGLDGNKGTDKEKAYFIGQLNQYLITNGYLNMGMTEYYSSHGKTLYTMNTDGTRGREVSNDDGMGGGYQAFPILFKNGGVAFLRVYARGVETADSDKVRENGGSFTDEAADVFIDVNGIDPPNTIGRDFFNFYMGDDGILYPFGGRDQAVFDFARDGTPIESQFWNNANDGCLENNIKNPHRCTARLVEEGYKMNY